MNEKSDYCQEEKSSKRSAAKGDCNSHGGHKRDHTVQHPTQVIFLHTVQSLAAHQLADGSFQFTVDMQISGNENQSLEDA